jgi:alpha-N-arabinofuranosidase
MKENKLKKKGSPANPQAILTINTDSPSKTYSPMIFGGFLEHFANQDYGGVFEPGSPLSDKNGFRQDVIKALKELKVPIVRWPGGCFVSGYHWEAGVGKHRTPVDDMAWGVIEPNTFGTDEYVDLCEFLGWQPYICNNAGNGTVEEMKNWVEYCNTSSSKFARSALRTSAGNSQAHPFP